MVKRIGILIFAWLPMLAFTQDGMLSAFVDRTEVSINDVFTLTIRVNAEIRGGRPDIDSLQQDFEIIGSSERNSFTFINGVSQQWSEFRISIRPRSTGNLTIPAFRVGNEVTMPITVMVSDGVQNQVSSDDFFLTSSVSKETVYVQGQLLYTVKIYFSVPFDQGAQLGAPVVENTVIQQLGNDISTQEVIDGLRYNVIERRFVLFPQSSGTLEISPISFTATVGRRRTGSIFSGQMTGGRAINLRSESHLINVLGKPATYPADATWLPSSNLQLEENWSGSLQDLLTGEAITRNLRLRADGLSSSLLPEIEYSETEALKFYPDQANREDLANQDGVTGIRSQGTAIVANEGGNFVLPEIEIPWWNTSTDSLEYARLPQHTLSVLPGNTSENLPGPIPVESDSVQIQTSAPETTQSNSQRFWILTTSIFAIAWLFSTLMWYRSKLTLKQFAAGLLTPSSTAKTLSVKNNEIKEPSVDKAFQNFQQACKNENLSDIKQALLIWARLHFSDKQIIAIESLKKYVEKTVLVEILDDLEKTLYSTNSDDKRFQSKALSAEIKRLHKKGYKPEKSTAEHYTLPPLYKN